MKLLDLKLFGFEIAGFEIRKMEIREMEMLECRGVSQFRDSDSACKSVCPQRGHDYRYALFKLELRR
ncbi:MAG: hypothetical protein IGS16_21425 [Thermoleptolyngbya sp. C42_A2020_037]|nr:hypothetical protein [Thermoleptolyngbya sp. C42_A2020_037]